MPGPLSTSNQCVGRSLIWMCLLVAFGPWTHAQRMETAEAEFTTYDAETGPAHDSIYSIVQGPRGFMWFGTQSSIDRFDGYHFHHYRNDPDNPNTYADGAGSAMALDGNDLWIGNWGRGLIRFDFDTEVFVHYRHDPADPTTISGNRIQSLFLDDTGTLWVGTYAAGLNRFDKGAGRATRFQHDPNDPNSLGDNRIWSMARDPRGRLWLGTELGLDCYDPATGIFTHHRADPKQTNRLPGNTVRAVLMAQGKLWVGTDNGAAWIDPTTDTIHPFPVQRDGNPKYGNIRAILEDSQGRLWFGTYKAGLIRYDPARDLLQYFQSEPERAGYLSHYRIETLYEDRAGVLWVGTNGGGIKKHYLSPKKFVHYHKKYGQTNSLGSNRTSTIYQDRDRILWVGAYDGGLDRIDRETNQFTHLVEDANIPNALVDNNVRFVIQAADGLLWIATYHQGIQLLDPQTMTFGAHYVHQPENAHSLSHSRVRVLLRDHRDRIWVGTEKGLDRFDDQKNHFDRIWPNAAFPKTLKMGRVLALFQDRDQRIWVATNRYLFHFDPEHPEAEPVLFDGPEYRDIYTAYQTSDGVLWFGGMAGMFEYEPRSRSFTQHNLSKDVNREIYGITGDDQDHLWISSSNGLIKYHVPTREIRVLLANDGIQGNTFNRGALFKAADGELFFGGTNGLTTFYPGRINDNQNIPNVVFNQFKVFNQEKTFEKPLHLIQDIELKYAQNMFSLSFAALDYAFPYRNRFVYQLEGFDKDWIPAGDLHQATYTNLDPGSYRFRVKGSNSDGIWNPEPAVMNLRIIPPFWRTTWFKGLTLMLILMVVAWRIWEIRANTRLLERRVAERTASLNAANEELARTAVELRNTQEQLVSAAHQAGMAAIAGDVLHNLGNALNSLNVSSDQLRESLDSIRLDFFQKVLDLLKDHQKPLAEFLTEHDRGKKIPEALKAVFDNINFCRTHAVSELDSLQGQLDYIKNIVKAQEEYAGTQDFYEDVHLDDLVRDAIRFQGLQIERLAVEVQYNFIFKGVVTIPKRKLMQVIRHLLKNSLEAVEGLKSGRRITMTVQQNEADYVRLEIADNGAGVAPELHALIFTHGMTTKAGAAGFGLHFCANTMAEFGGEIGVKSKGAGHGAVFILKIPIHPVVR